MARCPQALQCRQHLRNLELGTQLYAPYGSRLYQDQSMRAYTTKGFTGQYNDPTSGLDYYVSRFYDPVAGIFTHPTDDSVGE
jgi:RHS repeat-associated protein